MNYPSEILPNETRKIISCDIHSCFLIRATPTAETSDLIDAATGDIKQTAICSPTEHITDLSTSLLGVFTVEHNKIQLTLEGKKILGAYCDPDCNVATPVYEVDFCIDDNKGFWTILIEKILDKPVSYFFGDRPDEKFMASCSVVHTPTYWNYWHHSIKWYLHDHGCNLDEIEDERLKRKISKRLSGEARAMIAKSAKVLEPDYQELAESCYTK